MSGIERPDRAESGAGEHVRAQLPAQREGSIVEPGQPLEDLVGIRGAAGDLAPMKEIEHALRRSEERFRSIFERSAIGMALLDPLGRFEEANEAFCEMLGYTQERLRSMTYLDLTHPDDRAASIRFVDDVLERGETDGFSKRYVRSDGQVVWGEVHIAPLRDESGVPQHLIAQVQDVSARVRAERAREESERRFRSLFENNPNPVYTLDLDGRFTSGNSPCEELTGYELDELIGLKWTELARPEDLDQLSQVFAAAVAGEPQHFDALIVRKDGEPRNIAVTTFPMRIDGDVSGIYGICADVTVRKRAEEDRERLAAILEATSDFVGIIDKTGRVLYINAAARAAIEVPDDIPADSLEIKEMVSRWRCDSLMNVALPAAEESGSWAGEVTVTAPDGRELALSLVVLAHRAGGETQHYSLIARDLSEQKKLEARLRQSQKLEAVGRLAGGVAHDFNNLLVVIMNFAQFLIDDLDGHPAADDARQIHNAGERAANLVRQLLAFSRKDIAQPQPIDVAKTIEDLQKLLRRTIGEDVQLKVAAAPNLPDVEMDPSLFDQILVNLTINARDAMPNGGTVLIEAADVPADGIERRVLDGLEPGDYVRVSVIDDGIGMDQETLDRIFEPFFTTKTKETASGLGLATVYGIVNQAKGLVTATSTPGAGSRFDVYLPAASAPAEVEVRAVETPAAGGTGSVLVVEDEMPVANAIDRILRKHGYSVKIASTPADALNIVTEGACDVDVVLTDLVMPDMSGAELASELRPLIPGASIVFMSGYSGDVVERTGFIADDEIFIQKPFSSETLLSAIEGALTR